ncbi:hypothetical protein L6270_03410 [Candidatus Parcubacteria bacterium]|nr:hypothetical protein [Patescibacteria group bacterium]MBU4309012.1 hypothetical protein [Patescibacteria group bacterium]MBU4432394.1 hypothetical protein [Patescibacteria group bacterium]MBU4577372.1 hypothetical protein [Patescibacteria group bacterium]MCG2697060.1 hypothetical protein [Candidatus Parcubacteria bacterium]
MNQFEQYLENLGKHEDEKSKSLLDSRGLILVNAGIHLNRIGDYIANPKIKYKKIRIPMEKILFTGTEPDWNKILIEKCHRRVDEFKTLVAKDDRIRKKMESEASFGNETILLRESNEAGYYLVFDGMHRFVGAVLKNKKNILAYVPINEKKHLPICEAHVVYDLIRSFQRVKKDKISKQELYCALRLLARTYENVIGLLEKRFDFKNLPDEDVQEIIKKVVESVKK